MTEAFVSLATNDDYAKGALVLGKSLKRVQTTRKCVVLVTSGVSTSMRARLNEHWGELIDITALDSNDEERLAILARPELGCTFSKLRAWTLTQFKKCVFLDADTMVLQNVDELFEREELSAAPDVGWPDCFNSGVFVFKPSMETYGKLLDFAKTRGSFDGGDQGLLNDYFKDWATKDNSRRLPFLYNMVANITYSYTPAFMRYGQDVKIVHFLGSAKPWHFIYDQESGQIRRFGTGPSVSDQLFVKMWWDLLHGGELSAASAMNHYSYTTHTPVHTPSLLHTHPIECTHIHKTPYDAKHVVTVTESRHASIHSRTASIKPTTSTKQSLKSWENWDQARVVYATKREQWEKGTPDYHGDDKFDNILSHMLSTLTTNTDDVSEKVEPGI